MVDFETRHMWTHTLLKASINTITTRPRIKYFLGFTCCKTTSTLLCVQNHAGSAQQGGGRGKRATPQLTPRDLEAVFHRGPAPGQLTDFP